MKCHFLWILLLVPCFAGAQPDTQADSLARNVMGELKESWTLGVDSNSNTVDIAMYNKYKSLFDASAMIDDDLNVRFIPGKGTGTYMLNPVAKEFDVYAHDAALEISKLRVDSVSAMKNVSTADSVIYEITRTIYIEKPARYVLSDTNALAAMIFDNHPGIRFGKKNGEDDAFHRAEILARLKQELTRDPDNVYKFTTTSTVRVALAGNPLRISGIRNIANTLSCINDDDRDGILNDADSLRSQYGEFTAQGAPDVDLDGVRNGKDHCNGTYGSLWNKGCPESYFVTSKQVDGSVGLQFNDAMIGLPELNELGYEDASGADAIDVLQSQKGSLKEGGAVGGFYAAGNFTYFFGGNARRAGMSIGFSYGAFIASYELTNPVVYTYQSSDGADLYRRQVAVNSLHERMQYSVFAIPVQLNYRFKLGAAGNWVIQLRGGPSFIQIKTLTNYDVTADIGGIYQIDTVNQDRVAYYDFFDEQSDWNVYMTSSGIDRQASSPGAAAVFDQLAGKGEYDFTSGKVYREQQVSNRWTYALNVSADVQYRKTRSSPLGLKGGFHLVYAPSTGSKEKYVPIERTTDTFQSIFHSNGKSVYLAYGVSVGLVYDF